MNKKGTDRTGAAHVLLPAILLLLVIVLILLMFSQAQQVAQVAPPRLPDVVRQDQAVARPMAPMPPAAPMEVRVNPEAGLDGAIQPQTGVHDIAKPIVAEFDGPTRAAATAAGQRPAWVESPPHREGDVYRVAVESQFYSTLGECREALATRVKKAVDQAIDDDLGSGTAAVVQLDPAFIEQRLQKATFIETRPGLGGETQQLDVLLEFDSAAWRDIQNRWREARVAARLWHFGAGTMLVLTVLGAVFGYLKLDQRTAGSYNRRLQFAATVTILMAVAGAVMVHRSLPF